MQIKYCFLVLFFATTIMCFGQIKPTVADAIAGMDSILGKNEPQPSILIVGSFHFGYYNLDAHKVEEDEQVDVLSPARQKEMQELVDYISLYKPTKIAVESGPITGYILRNYEGWIKGERELGRSEREQIGFRLMKQFNLDTVYGVDAWPVMFDLYDSKDSLVMRPVFDSIYNEWDFRSDDSLSQLYSDYYDYDDQLTLDMSLLEYFKYMNNQYVLNVGNGSYLTGDFTLGTYEGADALAMHWYSRNLRIFRNIQKITTSPDDRILLIIGAGHAQLLSYLFSCSGEYEFVPFDAIDKQ